MNKTLSEWVLLDFWNPLWLYKISYKEWDKFYIKRQYWKWGEYIKIDKLLEWKDYEILWHLCISSVEYMIYDKWWYIIKDEYIYDETKEEYPILGIKWIVSNLQWGFLFSFRKIPLYLYTDEEMNDLINNLKKL